MAAADAFLDGGWGTSAAAAGAAPVEMTEAFLETLATDPLLDPTSPTGGAERLEPSRGSLPGATGTGGGRPLAVEAFLSMGTGSPAGASVGWVTAVGRGSSSVGLSDILPPPPSCVLGKSAKKYRNC
eukprot:Hpha_TRINITY_DN8607_c0_g1::TRINITY_DN8607_c0_g1_i1::g.168590::m.168590